MKLAAEKPTDELAPAEATMALSEAWCTARVSRKGHVRRFIAKALSTRKVGGTIVVDVTFSDDTTVTLRLSTAKAELLGTRLLLALGK